MTSACFFTPKMCIRDRTGYSGGIKNLFGTIPGLEKPQMHYRWPEIEDFSNMLLELAQTVAPNQMCIRDSSTTILRITSS